MPMLFKAVSEENFTEELNSILELNNINLADRTEKHGFFAWKGNGFQIEHSRFDDINVIFITNEGFAQTEWTEQLFSQ